MVGGACGPARRGGCGEAVWDDGAQKRPGSEDAGQVRFVPVLDGGDKGWRRWWLGAGSVGIADACGCRKHAAVGSTARFPEARWSAARRVSRAWAMGKRRMPRPGSASPKALAGWIVGCGLAIGLAACDRGHDIRQSGIDLRTGAGSKTTLSSMVNGLGNRFVANALAATSVASGFALVDAGLCLLLEGGNVRADGLPVTLKPEEACRLRPWDSIVAGNAAGR